ncbi:DNA binding protein [Pseudomonas phage vB_PseuGesM_254]|uniref:DNA binding protein n=1 Tax=Pseudomonas phage vB_PseuGesM_254 TaxID=3092638 RepID=A0AAX4G847_9CAUD|nr:DNA binding protein [Pseudomonas phage PseuGes_254]
MTENYEESFDAQPESITKQQYFDRVVNVLVAAEAIKEDLKSLAKLAKANDIVGKPVVAAAKLYVKNVFEEKQAEFGAVEAEYKELTGYDDE